MTALTPAGRDRLLKLLALLGSDHSGERNAATLTAVRFLRQRGLAWSNVIAFPAPIVLPAWRAPLDWRKTADFCLRYLGALRGWKIGFLRNLGEFLRLLSSNYKSWLKLPSGLA